MRVLNVFSNGVHVGTLSDTNDVWTFEYTGEWLSREDAFDLSPALKRETSPIVDGSSIRPVQWYFDNLLPEERMREVLAKEANISWHDAFGLLAYFGVESAGSLVLLPPSSNVDVEQGLVPLSNEVLSARIKNLSKASLTHDAPKKMSLAGAQHKLLIVIKDGQLYEPLRGSPSTWILKPPHQSSDYPASVVNEYFTMRLAKTLGLDVPEVDIRYVPEPVYVVKRFDRNANEFGDQRLHVIDTCQLLNKAPGFKYLGAKLDALQDAIRLSMSPAAARQRLFEWAVFNVLIGNGDNHLKNLSFMVDRFGIHPAPIYDLLCTAVYETQAFAGEQARWPNSSLAFTLGDAKQFNEVTRDTLIATGLQLGLAKNNILRVIDRFVEKLPNAVSDLIVEISEITNTKIAESPSPERSKLFAAGDHRLLNAIRHIIIPDMLKRAAL